MPRPRRVVRRMSRYRAASRSATPLRFLRLCDGPGQVPAASSPPRSPGMRSSSEPPFPGQRPSACCGELPSGRRVRRTGREGPPPAGLLPSPALPMFTDCSNACIGPVAGRNGFVLRLPAVSVVLDLGPLPDSPDHALRRRDVPDQPHGRSQHWSDERDEQADLARGPRGTAGGSGCRNGRRHAGRGKPGGEVERAQEPQLAVRDRIQGLRAGFDVVVDAGAGGRRNFAFAEAAACSSVDQLMRCAYTWMTDSSPPPTLPWHHSRSDGARWPARRHRKAPWRGSTPRRSCGPRAGGTTDAGGPM